MDTSENLFALFRSLAAGDRGRASELLEEEPALALAPLSKGGERGGSSEFFLEELQHQLYAGDTALHVAAAAYDVEFANALVARGAAVGATNRRGAQPLHYAVDGNPSSSRWDPVAQAAMVSFLIANGADLDHRDKNGTPPLLRAVRNRCATAVEALLAGGADPNATNAKGSTALQLTDHSTGRGGSGTAEAKAEQDVIIGLLRAAGATR